MKKILKISIVSILLLAIALGAVSCGAPVAQNAEGTHENITWKYDAESKTLTLSGSGDIKDLDGSAAQPWAASLVSAEKLIISEGITGVGSFSFYGASALKSAILPSSLTKVGKSAFAFCTKLEEATLPLGVTTIGENAFCGCSALKAAFVPASVTEMGEGVFSYCYAATDVAFLAKRDIPAATFLNCRAAERILLHSATKEKNIADNAFEGITKTDVSKASYTESDTGSATVSVSFIVEGEAFATELRENLSYGAAYSITAPTKEGYTPEKLNVTGNVYGENIDIKVNYTKDPEPEQTQSPVAEEEEPVTAGTIVSVVVLVVVLIGIAVGAFFIIRNEKKANQKDARTVRKNSNDKKRK